MAGVSCPLEISLFLRFLLVFQGCPCYLYFLLEVVGNGTWRIWIPSFGTKSWCRRLAGHSRLQNAQRVSSTDVWLSSNSSTGHFLWGSRLQGEGVNLHVSLRTWSGPWEKDWLELRPKMCMRWLYICVLFTPDFHLTRPGYLWYASASIWNFGSLLKSLSTRRKFSSFPSLTSNIAVFLSEIIHKKLDNELTSVHFQWSRKLLKPVDFKYIPKGISEF